MIDKAVTVARDNVGRVIGRLDEETMAVVNRELAIFLSFA